MVSGSARSLMTDLVASQRSPFFGHFELLEVGEFEAEDAIALLIERLDWHAVVASVTEAGEVTFLDPAKGRRKKGFSLTSAAVIDNLLLWVDRAARMQAR